MKNRITAFALALVLTLFGLPFTPVTTEAAYNFQGSSYDLDDFARYGTSEEYIIVPCNAPNSCVDLNASNGTYLQIWQSAKVVNQIWTLESSGEYYYIKCKWNGKVVDVPGFNAAANQQLHCYDSNGGDNQLWRLESMGDGTYMIHSKINDSLVWCVQHASWDDGKAIMLFRTTGDPNERFRFVHASTIESTSDWGSSRQDCDGTDWSVWDNGCSYDWYYNHRNERDLYISNASELFGLTSLVANGYEMLSKTIHLTRDINLAGITWTPIGYYGHTFRGSFNGHNHTITKELG